MPVKPLFLDVAWNYIEYPGQEGKVINGETGAAAMGGKDEKRRGWFGWGGRA